MALVLSAVLLIVAFSVLGGLIFLNNKYNRQGMQTDQEIAQEQNKMRNESYAELINFQEGLNLLDKAVDDHVYWDKLLLSISPYVIPEVHLESFSGKINPGGSALIEISGVAVNLEALSRELILLKNFPGLDSLELKEAGASAGQSGVQFNAELKISQKAFEK